MASKRSTRQPALGCDRAQPSVRIHRDRLTDGPEERDVARGVGVGGRLLKVDALGVRELDDRRSLRKTIEAPVDPSRVQAVLDLGSRAHSSVEPELVDERVDDLLERGGDDERALAALSVPLDEIERVAIHVGPKRRVHRLLDDLAHHLHRKPLEEGHRALSRLPDP